MFNQNEQFDFLDFLSIIGFTLQLENLRANSKQTTNDELMRELQEQDRKYLEKLIANQNQILSMLEKIQSK